jgi:hypothetical protein
LERLVVFSCRMVGQDVGELLQVLAAALTPQNTMCIPCFGFATLAYVCIAAHAHRLQRHNSPVFFQPNVTSTCFQVLGERAQQFHPFISSATNVAASAVKSTRSVFNASNDGHMLLLRRLWASGMGE